MLRRSTSFLIAAWAISCDPVSVVRGRTVPTGALAERPLDHHFATRHRTLRLPSYHDSQ